MCPPPHPMFYAHCGIIKKISVQELETVRKEQKESARNTQHSETNRPAAAVQNSVTSVAAIIT